MTEGAEKPRPLRVFVAVPLDEEARHALAAIVAARFPRGMPGRPVSPENWHLTLRFLGWVDEVVLDRVLAALDAADLGPPFPIRWGALGAFPSPRRASVLWVGVDRGEERMAILAAVVSEALEGAGFEPEDRPFHPHLTVSRFRPRQDVTPAVAGSTPAGVAMEVDRMTVFQSHLGRGGARYEPLEEFPLG